MVPLYAARVSDLSETVPVMMICNACSHSKPVSKAMLVERLGPDARIVALGPEFRCMACGKKGAVFVAAAKALGHLR